MSVETIDAYYAAMRRGAQAEHDMMALFTDDAVYDEPFSGSDAPAVGSDAIRERLRLGWQAPLPDLELDVLSVRISGAAATCTWECHSSGLPAPVRGTDEYEFRDGKIAALRVRLLDSAD